MVLHKMVNEGTGMHQCVSAGVCNERLIVRKEIGYAIVSVRVPLCLKIILSQPCLTTCGSEEAWILCLRFSGGNRDYTNHGASTYEPARKYVSSSYRSAFICGLNARKAKRIGFLPHSGLLLQSQVQYRSETFGSLSECRSLLVRYGNSMPSCVLFIELNRCSHCGKKKKKKNLNGI